MKKIFVTVALLILSVILLMFTSCDINRMGKDNVYIVVIEHTDTREDKLDSGEVITRYIYNQRAFAEEGESIEVEFSAGKELRQEAYLMLYINKENEVTSYDEVKWGEIPSKAQVELEDYYMDN